MATFGTKGSQTWGPVSTRKLQVSLDNHSFLKGSLLLFLLGHVSLSAYVASWRWHRVLSKRGSQKETDVYSKTHHWAHTLHRLATSYFNLVSLKAGLVLRSLIDIFCCRILGVMPLSALFVLFDFVVHNPYHPESSTNLTFLDVVGAYFTRLEYSTGGSLPSSLVAEFALIARQFIRDIQLSNSNRNGGAIGNTQYQPPAGEKQYDEPIKPYDQVREIDQALIYQQSQMVSEPSVSLFKIQCCLTFQLQPQVEQIPATASQVMTGDSMGYVEQLFYPTDDLQPFMTGDLASGFDITGLFDTMLPNFQF